MRTRTAILTGTAALAADIQRQLDPKRERFFVLRPEANVHGLWFDALLVTDDYYRRLNETSWQGTRRIEEWYHEGLLRRLAPGARVVRL